MNVTAYKLNIINQILLVKDEQLLTTIENLLRLPVEAENNSDDQPHDFWLDLTDAQKEKIAFSLRQIEIGESVSGKDVIGKLRQKYKQ
jgi:hypothetical protein